MALLTRDQILTQDDIKTEEIDCPEWGGSVLIRGLTGQERDQYESSMQERRGNLMVPNLENMRARLVCWGCIDKDGNRLFNLGDMDELGKKSAAPIDRLSTAIARISGMNEEAISAMIENFGKTDGSDSPSTSPKPSGRPGKNSSATQTAAS